MECVGYGDDGCKNVSEGFCLGKWIWWNFVMIFMYGSLLL